MNQLEAIQVVATGDGFEKGFHLVYICPDCMNEVLEDEEQASLMDWGLIRVLVEKFRRCDINKLVDCANKED